MIVDTYECRDECYIDKGALHSSQHMFIQIEATWYNLYKNQCECYTHWYKATSNIANLYLDTSWQSISVRRDDTMLIMLYKVKHDIAPDYLRDLLPLQNENKVLYIKVAKQQKYSSSLLSFRIF